MLILFVWHWSWGTSCFLFSKQCVSADWASGHMLMANVLLCNCMEEWHQAVADPGFDLRGGVDFVNGVGVENLIESVKGWSKIHVKAYCGLFLLK